MVALIASADPASGEKVFRKCSACHKVNGEDGVGPHLDGVIDRDIASVAGFGYSGALSGLEGAWTVNELSAFIANPKGYAPGTSMGFAGLKKPEERADVIAYLQSVGG
jgi:cytochrome c